MGNHKSSCPEVAENRDGAGQGGKGSGAWGSFVGYIYHTLGGEMQFIWTEHKSCSSCTRLHMGSWAPGSAVMLEAGAWDGAAMVILPALRLFPLPFFSLPLPSHLLVIPILCPTKSQPLSQACAAVLALLRGVQVSREGISLCSAHRETSLPELLNPLENLCFLFTKLFTWSRFCSVDCSQKTSRLPRCRNGQCRSCAAAETLETI